MLDPGGETVVLVDDEGRVLSNDEALLVLLTLVSGTAGPGAAGLPTCRGPRW